MNFKSDKQALALFSGGLDSTLAIKVLQEQGVDVTAVSFKSYFWETTKAEKAAKKLKIPFFIEDFSKEHLKMVKKPKHGYGKAANPCVDCHTLMLKKAAKYTCEVAGCSKTKAMTPRRWKRGVFDFVATGEVLGQRPFSQNKGALSLIAKESGLGDLLLRPLSAQLLPETLPEKKGWVDRKKLLAIQGRSRKIQIQLAKKFGLTDYPQPAGGCRLTEQKFSQKLFNLLKSWPKATGDDVALLKIGRHFWENKALIVLGRNHQENLQLAKLQEQSLKSKKDRPFLESTLVIPKNFPGPTALIRGQKKVSPEIAKKAQKLVLSFTSKPPQQPEFMIK